MEDKQNSDNLNLGLKKDTTNTLLNIVIILLIILIMYLGYSIFAKLGKNKNQSYSSDNSQVSEIIQAEVLNGSGVKGLGERFTEFLRNNKVDVVATSNYINNDVAYTLVIDRRGNMANAEKVADLLGVDKKHIIQQLNDEYFLDITVIIGKDYFNLEPLK